MTDIEYLKKYLKKEELEEGLEKLKTGYPAQYIVGDVNFYGYQILVNENVLIPRFETELLVEKTINYIKQKKIKNLKILDIGTGSGAIAIALKKAFPDSFVTAVDISNEALNVARKNAEINGVSINFVESDVFSNVFDKYNVIISNPPYIDYGETIDEKVRKYEPNLALFAEDEGLYFYKKILSEVQNYIESDAMICFEIGETQGKKIAKISENFLPNSEYRVEKDYPGKDRFVFISVKNCV